MTTRASEHVRRERGDRLHRIAAVGGAKRRQQISVPDRRAKPLAAEPESGAFVAESRPETAGARPAAARVSTDDDRSGAREQKHARLPSERAEQSGLGVGDHKHSRREPAKRAREGPALGGSPEAARRDHECGDAPPTPSTATPDRAQDGRELLEIAIGGNNGGRDAMCVPNRDADPRSADVRAHAHGLSFRRVSFRGGGCHSVYYEAGQMIRRPLK